MCFRSGDSSPEEAPKPPPRKVTKEATTPAPPTTTTAVTTQKTSTQSITSTPILKNTKSTFHSTIYVDVSKNPTLNTRSSPLNRKATVSSARDGSKPIEFGLIGAAIGGLVLLLMVLLVFFIIYKQKRSKTNKNGSRGQDAIDSNENGKSRLTAEMGSLTSYDEEQGAQEGAKPLYSQVNKTAKTGPPMTLETQSQIGYKAVEKSGHSEKSKNLDDGNEMVDNQLYETDSVHERSPEAEIPQTGEKEEKQLENTESVTLNKVNGRVTYENVEATIKSNTYENQSDRQPESDWGSAYDKLDRLDHIIGNEKVIGENVYDM